MNDSLKNMINNVKEELEYNSDGILIGQIRKGNPTPKIEDSNGALVEYVEIVPADPKNEWMTLLGEVNNDYS
ncbi:hypothetical protein MNQ98_23375 [Paenibacillus sp. N3/727]|uniref:hypothetical protein n=1 Tax=Paenibacillus sp. N3/727 TaxID=2925845 RepID=UPI001F532994|nr:hypothetical protein [Paenibacillus sp. N3/727]UNK17389.1 hypothetical protein MNQ98_23375 [Paenibacillus sp. N3/727]